MGCLTDGKQWDFVYIMPSRVKKLTCDENQDVVEEEVDGYEVYETLGLGATKKEEIKVIMGSSCLQFIR